MGSLIYFLISHMQFWAAAVIAYFCGCFNGAVIVSKYILRDDVRNHGSGNAGLTNFFRTFGGPLTFVVILCDVLKAVAAIKISVWLGGYFDPRIMPDTPMENQALLLVLFKYWGGLFCLLGHMFPCMFHFKGGKGILSGGTIAIMIEPVQGEGGVHPATQEFMTGLREFCDENGMLLLPDLNGTDPVRFPRLSVGRGQLSLYQLVLLPPDADHCTGLLPGRIDRLEAPGQYPALAGGK